MSKLFVTTEGKRPNYKEGDVWTENGKDWTIKNGLKRTVSRMDAARKQVFTPLACPKCGGSMKHSLDAKMWTYNQRCYSCTIAMEHEIITSGKWKEYERARITANAEAFVEDMEMTLNDYIQDSVSKTNVTEDGLLESWKDADKGMMQAIVDKEVDELKTKVENYKND